MNIQKFLLIWMFASVGFYAGLTTFVFPILGIFGMRDILLDCTTYEKNCTSKEWVKTPTAILCLTVSGILVYKEEK